MSSIGDGFFDRVQNVLASQGIVDRREGPSPFPHDLLHEEPHLARDRVRVRHVCVAVDDVRLVDHPIIVAVAGRPLGSDHLDVHAPRIGAVVVRGEVGLEVRQGTVRHLHVDHRHVLLLHRAVVEARGKRGHAGRRPPHQVDGHIRVVGEDLTDDALHAIPPCELRGVMDVEHDVGRHNRAEISIVDDALRTVEPRFVDVVVARHDRHVVFLGAGLERFEFSSGGSNRLLDQDRLLRFHRHLREVVMSLHVRQHEHSVHSGVTHQLLGRVVQAASIPFCHGLGIGYNWARGEGPDANELGLVTLSNPFVVQRRDVSRPDERAPHFLTN
mmetsp:Transcript_21094/g.39591  ORF Transcript_21094/g.39591 Transcript_21094/m.39591 type:complete len:328 (-) Transcript_21094:119-1102(-)